MELDLLFRIVEPHGDIILGEAAQLFDDARLDHHRVNVVLPAAHHIAVRRETASDHAHLGILAVHDLNQVAQTIDVFDQGFYHRREGFPIGLAVIDQLLVLD